LTFAHSLSYSNYNSYNNYASQLLCQLEMTSLKNLDCLDSPGTPRRPGSPGSSRPSSPCIDSDEKVKIEAEIQKIPRFSTFTAIKPKVVPSPTPVFYCANSFETVYPPSPPIELKQSIRCALCCDFA
jgi:hypothetical protein